jgi:gamma-glutamyltranspeptidase/glutathione hydrolase
MVATSQPLATGIGVDVLRRGGSAVDAAIAANAALGLMEPTGCGIGGDLFALVWEASAAAAPVAGTVSGDAPGAASGGRLHGLNASGRSPRALERAHFGGMPIPYRGPLSLSTPGAVDGWFELHGRFGRLPIDALLAPAIEYARAGFPVTEVIAAGWQAEARTLHDAPGFGEVYMPGGTAPREGQRFANPALASAYELIAERGRDAFYRGPIAAAVAEHVQRHHGFLSADDFAAHASEWVAPVTTTYRGWEVAQLPPNGQGLAVLEMLNVLEGFDLAALDFGSAPHLHLLVEAKKLAFEDRARYYADPSCTEVPVAALVAKSYATARRALIDPTRAAAFVPCGEPPFARARDTVYLAAADADGNMVSLIQSNYHGFGSGVTVPRYGFGLQNRGTSFALDPSHPNVYAPGKRPFHTIIPGFATRPGHALLAFGVMGGDMQPQGQVQVLSNMIDFAMNLQEAGDAPRVRHEGSSEPVGGAPMRDGGTVYLEPGFAAAAADGLRARDHRVAVAESGFGGYQAVLRDLKTGFYQGASEARKDGHAAGF